MKVPTEGKISIKIINIFDKAAKLKDPNFQQFQASQQIKEKEAFIYKENEDEEAFEEVLVNFQKQRQPRDDLAFRLFELISEQEKSRELRRKQIKRGQTDYLAENKKFVKLSNETKKASKKKLFETLKEK